MPKKKPQILKKAMNLLTISIPIHKLRKPINTNLLLFKKTRKIKHLNLLKHHNYYIGAYQFSPPSTPLLNKTPFKKGSRGKLYSMFLLCSCSGNSSGGGEKEEEEEDGYESEDPTVDVGRETEALDSEGEGESVDRRAEKFIERFYEEIRIQRQESVIQYMEMLNRGCG
ncbi:uncharacterized protein LOC131230494 [Magnolia sinica]|uniref:uncharacterized protein LOC131230494 n=1 Tax=Magnolia sinica TaxID=86752 RepID=UPI00265AF3B0|nr:uncharacterized protein LOC131230494 [Magnolia sinica]